MTHSCLQCGESVSGHRQRSGIVLCGNCESYHHYKEELDERMESRRKTAIEDFVAAEEPLSETMALLKGVTRMVDHSVNYSQPDSADQIRLMLHEANAHLQETIRCFAS